MAMTWAARSVAASQPGVGPGEGGETTRRAAMAGAGPRRASPIQRRPPSPKVGRGGTLRRELLDQTLILSRQHLALVLREHLINYKGRQPGHRAALDPAQASPLIKFLGLRT